MQELHSSALKNLHSDVYDKEPYNLQSGKQAVKGLPWPAAATPSVYNSNQHGHADLESEEA